MLELASRRFSDRMRRALVRVAAGEPYRKAAAAEGVGWRELWRNAASVPGLREERPVGTARSNGALESRPRARAADPGRALRG